LRVSPVNLINALLLLIAAPLTSLPLGAQPVATEPTLALEDCRIRAGHGYPGIKARCGTLLRHENPDDPDSPLLELFVAVVPALSLEPEPDAFVPIAGGPGQGSMEFYASYAVAFEKVRRNRDIVLLDQRGTGQSAVMDCEADEEIIEGRFSREETIADAEACLAALPYDPRFFTTSVAVTDLEALRVALGYTQFNLYGISYGSRVAQHFMRRFPDSTRTVILDGVVAPQIALGPGIAIEAQDALDAILDRCDEDLSCAGRFPGIRQGIKDLLHALDNEAVTVKLANPLRGTPEELAFGRYEMSAALRLLSYHPSTVALLPMLIEQAILGNFMPLAAQYMMIAESMSDAMALGMHNSVVCTEDAPYFAGENVSVDALGATYIGPLQLEGLAAICSVWPAGVLDENFKAAVDSDLPVLLLSGEADPVTPPAYAELAAVDLGNARLLIGAHQGHGQAARGCMPDIIAEFVAGANATEIDASCFDRVHAMPFFLDFSGPSQ
jgi:pimeloyl-ACP methyl ester carboxylesterase